MPAVNERNYTTYLALHLDLHIVMNWDFRFLVLLSETFMFFASLAVTRCVHTILNKAALHISGQARNPSPLIRS
jgi:hypothetical protein